MRAGRRLWWRLALVLACLQLPAAGTTDPPKVRHILFYGAEQLSAGRLRNAMRLRQRSWWQPFRKNYFYGTDHLEADLGRIAARYQEEGYLFARIEEAVVRYVTRDWVDIEVSVQEGARVHVRNITVAGVADPLQRELRRRVRTRPGVPLQERRLRADEERLLDHCLEQGYALTDIQRELRIRRDSAAVTYAVHPGPLIRVGDIRISGQERTREDVIRREVTLRPGDTFRLSRAVRSQQRLFDLGLFRSARLVPAYGDTAWLRRQGSEAEVDLTVEVSERPPGWYGFGFGYSSRDRVRFLGEWGYRNLWGRARSLSASAEIAYSLLEEPAQRFRRPKEWEVDLTYGAPWLFQTPTRWRVRTYYRFKRWFEEGPTLDEHIVGAELEARWDLSRFRRLIGSIENKWTSADSSYVTRFISLGYAEDRRDFILDPHRGRFMQAKIERAGDFLGGEADFTRWIASYATYIPLGVGFTWAHRVRVGYIHVPRRKGDAALEAVPIEERFYAGGGTTVRGYAEESLGPQTEGQVRGGLAQVLLNAELRVRLVGQLGIAIFLDGGNVWADYRQIKWSRFANGWTRAGYSPLDVAFGLGAGLRFMTPVGPLRLDHGRKLNRGFRSVSAREYEWHLSLGHAF